MIELLDIRPKISVTNEYIQNEELKVKSIESEELKVKSEEFNGLANHKVQSSNLKVQSKEVQSKEVQSKEVQSKEVQSIADFREAIRPKKPLPDAEFESRRYYQVYEQKFGFQPNMSILDLLFNEGNEAIFYL